MNTLVKTDILNLSVSERIQLVEDIWDSIAQVPESIELSEAQRVELDKRLDAYHRDPSQGSPWNVVRGRIGNQK